MDIYLTIAEASRIAHVPTQELFKLVSSGNIKSIKTSTGEYLVSETDVKARVPLNQRLEYKDHAHLAGVPISMSEASRRYNVPQQTISRWVQRGLIARLGAEGRKVFIDEAEVATVTAIYHASEGHQGKWIFTNDGAVYTKKHK